MSSDWLIGCSRDGYCKSGERSSIVDEYDLSPRMVKMICECMPLDQLYECTSNDPAQLDVYHPADAKRSDANLIKKGKRPRYEITRSINEARRIAFGPAH